ncbi:MAG TPA: matrixin family metalloprotease [Mycobacteriales bacterium]|nr:matrixin family metalloprotease [Mycobacteriales bacterium]
MSPAPDQPWRAGVLVVPRVAPRRGRDRRGALAIVLCLALTAGAVRWGLVPDGGVAGALDSVRRSVDGAPPGAAVQRVHRPLPAPAVPDAGTSYAFLAGGSSAPVAWNACRPMHVVVRPDGAPPGSREQIVAALAELSAATGLQVVDDGDTDEAPAGERAGYQPARYGKQWAPVLIAWSDPAQSPELAGHVAGFAGPIGYQPAGRRERWVSGTLVLDGPQLADRGSPSAARGSLRTVVLHELGHIAGLAHVDDPTQLMNPTSDPRGPTAYADGDLHGLAVLGSQPCP